VSVLILCAGTVKVQEVHNTFELYILYKVQELEQQKMLLIISNGHIVVSVNLIIVINNVTIIIIITVPVGVIPKSSTD
jgi:hypothetical protein